jgi:hypothetical protein
MQKHLTYFFLVTIFFNTSAQNNESNKIKSADFKEGIFETFYHVKENKPIQKSQIVTDIEYSSFDFFDRLLDEKEITYFDNLGVNTKIKTDNIWGYSNKGILYINFNNEFNRIPVFGSISHFIANKTYIEYDPYRYNSYNRYSYDPYNSKTVLLQYILDFNTGKIYEFDYKSVELLLSSDSDLFEEYSQLSLRKKKKLQFLYIRKFNQKHPVILP